MIVGHFAAWPVEAGNIHTGVTYQVQEDGQVYRLELGNPCAKAVGRLTWIPFELEPLWSACDALYWDEVTSVRPPSDPDLTPVRPTQWPLD